MGTPSALDYSTDNCTIGRAMEILGERWTFVVIREIFNGVRRFDDMRTRTAIPRQVLSNRLNLLLDHDIVHKVPYRRPGARERSEYRLTEKGFDLYPVLIAIADWGDRYLADPEGPPVEFVHAGCGEQMLLTLSCAAGHEIDDPRAAVPQLGPGARLRKP